MNVMRLLFERLCECIQQLCYGYVARCHGAYLFRQHGAEEWCVARESHFGTTFGFGKTPQMAWHDYEYSRMTGE